MKKHLLILLSALTLTGCTNNTTAESSLNSTESSTLKVTDLVGREVEVSKDAYKKVVCIGAGALRLYSYIGDVNYLVGVEDIDRNVGSNNFEGASRPYYDLNKEVFEKLPSCGKGGPQAQSAEYEKILSCNPSLIISEYEDVEKANDLQSKTNVPVLVVKYGRESVFDENIKNSISLLGNVLNNKSKADNLNTYIANSKTELQNFALDVEEKAKPAMYVGCLGNWGRQDIFSTSSYYPLFNVSGIKNVVDSTIQLNNGNLEEEAFFKLNPDIIVVDSAGLSKFKTTYNNKKEQFKAMKAFSENNVYLQMPFNAYYTNVEIALMDAYFLASLSYSSKFTNFDLEKKYDEISNAFLSKPCYDIIKSAKYSYGGFQKIDNLEAFLDNVE